MRRFHGGHADLLPALHQGSGLRDRLLLAAQQQRRFGLRNAGVLPVAATLLGRGPVPTNTVKGRGSLAVMMVLRVLGRALLLCFGASLAAVVLSLAGWWMVAIFSSVGFGFLAMSLGGGWLDERRGSTSVAAFGGLIIVVAASIVTLGSVEQRLWPNRASGFALERAHDDFWATSFAFQSGRPRPELAGQAAVFGRHGTAVDSVSVVPVVEESWKPEDPIMVWAVARRETKQERSRLWQQPNGIGVRVSGFYVSDYQAAVKDACRSHELRSSRDPLFIEWTTAPDASLIAAWRRLGTIVLVATLSLFVLIVMVKIFQPRRR
jgi:hypothetical protein